MEREGGYDMPRVVMALKQVQSLITVTKIGPVML